MKTIDLHEFTETITSSCAGGVDLGWPQIGDKQLLAAKYVKRQKAVAVEESGIPAILKPAWSRGGGRGYKKRRINPVH